LAGEDADEADHAAHEAPARTAEPATDRTASSAPAAEPTPPPYRQVQPSPLSPGPSGVNVTLDELCSASGLPADKIAELERFGFLAGRPVAGVVYYDEEAMVVANLAARFLRFGIEARHLRPYKNAAEREAGLFEQIVTP